jgi:hypothetical protein
MEKNNGDINFSKDADCLQPSDVPENISKCHICSAGLSYIENMLYGNRCLFCAEKVKRICFLNFIVLCYYDFMIYKLLAFYKERERGRMNLLGALGAIGYADLHSVNTIDKKKELLRELKYGINSFMKSEGVKPC